MERKKPGGSMTPRHDEKQESDVVKEGGSGRRSHYMSHGSGVGVVLYKQNGKIGKHYHSDPDQGELWTDKTAIVSIGDPRWAVLYHLVFPSHSSKTAAEAES
jgi:hypothetical protein